MEDINKVGLGIREAALGLNMRVTYIITSARTLVTSANTYIIIPVNTYVITPTNISSHPLIHISSLR